MDDLGLKLRLARDGKGLSQKDVARLCSVGEKTLSSFESSARIKSMKFSQLVEILGVYGMTVVEFLTWNPGETHVESVEKTSADVAAAAETQVSETRAAVPLAPRVRRRAVDPLERVRSGEESPYPSPQSALRDVV